MVKRTDRLNSLLKEVISEVIHKEVKNPLVHDLTTVTRVEITKDLRYAKVYVSIIAEDKERQETLEALNSGSGFIAVQSSNRVTMRYFPALQFKLDDSVDKHMRIEELLAEIHDEQENRSPSTEMETTDEPSC